MKIGYYCESPADQAALTVFAGGLLGAPPGSVVNMDLQGHGVTGVLGALDGVFRGIYYRTDAEGLIVVVDSDDTEPHAGSHDTPGGEHGDCRLCKVRSIIAKARRLRPRQGRPELKVAVGLAVPAIEAWYLVGKEPGVGEPAWRAALNSGRRPFTRPQLKKLVYGTDRPSLERETEYAVREAKRIVQSGIAALETAFPHGFGPLAGEVRSWAARQAPPAAGGS